MQQSVARQCTGKGNSCSSDLDLISLILILDPDIVKKNGIPRSSASTAIVWISAQRQHVDMTKCSVFSHVSNLVNFSQFVHKFGHDPFTDM